VPRPRRVDLFRDALRDQTVWSLSEAQRGELAGCLLGRIGLDNGVLLATELAAKNHVFKAGLVIDALGVRLKSRAVVRKDAGLLAPDIARPAPVGSREEIEAALAELRKGLPEKQQLAAAPWEKAAREKREADAQRSALHAAAVEQFVEICGKHASDGDDSGLAAALWPWVARYKASFAELAASDAGKFGALFQFLVTTRSTFLQDGRFEMFARGKLLGPLRAGPAPVRAAPSGGDPAASAGLPGDKLPGGEPSGDKPPGAADKQSGDKSSGQPGVGGPPAGPVMSGESLHDRMLYGPIAAYTLSVWVSRSADLERLLDGIGAKRIHNDIWPTRLGRIVEIGAECGVGIERIIEIANREPAYFAVLARMASSDHPGLRRELSGRSTRVDEQDRTPVIAPTEAFIAAYLRDLPASETYLSVAEGQTLAQEWDVEARVFNQLRAPKDTPYYRDRESGQWYRAGTKTHSDGHCLIHGMSLILRGVNAERPEIQHARLLIRNKIDPEAVRVQCADLIRSKIEGAPQHGMGYFFRLAMANDRSINDAILRLAQLRAAAAGGPAQARPAASKPAAKAEAPGDDRVGSISFNTVYGAGRSHRGILLFVNGNHYIMLEPIAAPALPPVVAVGVRGNAPPSGGSALEDPSPSGNGPAPSAAKDGAAKDGAAKDGAAKDGAAKDGAAKDGAAKDGAAKDGAAKDGAPPPELPARRDPPPLGLDAVIRFRAPNGVSRLTVSALHQGSNGEQFYARERNPSYPASGPEYFFTAPRYDEYGTTWCLDADALF
jgi:hypothetical protein